MSGLASHDVVAHAPFPARRGGSRATTWWGKAWVRAVEEAAFAETDLREGRTLSRSGGVGGITVSRGGVVASVTDRRGLWTTACRVPQLDAEAVDILVEVVAAEAGRIGALLAGDLPHGLVEHADETGVELLPYGGELETTCTCDGWLDPCRHALAVLYQLTWLLEADPITLLHLRGLPRDELLARLHALGPATLTPSHDEDVELDSALDAAVRAARVLDLLEESSGSLDHLF